MISYSHRLKFFLSVKEFIFLTHWVVPIVAMIYFLNAEDTAVSKYLLGFALAFSYFIQNKRLNETKFAMEAFRDFNERYDKLNEPLNRILKGLPLEESKDKTSRTPSEVMVDYFNLCSEEYLLFTEGYIPSRIWKSWERGMKVIFTNEAVSRAWDEEIRQGFTDSYYGFDPHRLR